MTPARRDELIEMLDGAKGLAEIETCTEPRKKLALIAEARRKNLRARAELKAATVAAGVSPSALAACQESARVWLAHIARQDTCSAPVPSGHPSAR